MRGLQLTVSHRFLESQTAAAPSPLARSAWVERANLLLEASWRRGWSQKPQLDAGAVLRTGQTGLPVVGFEGREKWVARLEGLVTALHQEARLNALGRTIAYGQLARMVSQRTQLELLWQRHPEILQISLPPPIIVLGQMRSGTTRMQRMLASDPRLGATRFCDGWFSVQPDGFDLRPAKAWAALHAIKLLNPQFSAIHPTSPTAPDEEIGWLALDFASTPYDAQWRIPSFVESNQAADAAPTYQVLKRLLQTYRWRNRDDERPRILKVPQFMEDIDALLSVFPEASIVRVTRDPASVVASSCSLVANQRTVQSDSVNLQDIGSEWLARTLRRESIAKKSVARHAFAYAEISYREMEEDWRGSIRRAYRALGMRIDDDLLNRMDRQRVKCDAGRSPHHYRLSDFGLTADSVLRKFEDNAPVRDSNRHEISRQFLPA
jgi:Sulfotransferase family